ncbi:outer membrane protein TolC [Pontibacter ummariensis]|uniref:Outer membrane protein TolC n=1 Tax=Pontibacter ummariensis TaxID=1610492 RepID=A0A239IRU5_9BACT|nr:TolC family protein [Pontibacter ummariensis]PRY09675.1 outer membrane protein TolC [Pontibacter ummariensis]SNS96287.1 Outer membrane protein TolC [Pontibacter ummariensis]
MLSIKKYRLQSLPLKGAGGCFAFAAGLLLMLFNVTASQAQAPQQPVALDSVLQTIRSNNPMLQQYDLLAKAQEAYAEGATGWMAPMVGAGVFMLPYPGQNVERDEKEGSYMLSAEQAIPNPAKQRAKQAYYDSRAAIELAKAEATFNELRAEAKTAYYNWVVLEKKLDVLQDSERIMEYMLKLARIRYPYSQGKLGSIYKAEARLHEVENMQLMTRNEIIQKNVALNTLMNLPKEQTFRIDTLISIPEAVVLAADTAYLTETRSDILQLDRTIESMRLGVEQERLERKPDFRLRFDHMTPRNNMMPDQFTAMGMVTIPIAPWSSKMYKANVKAMNLEIEAMQRERENILNEAQGMVRNMALELNAKREQVENYRTKIIPALKKNYDVTMLAYEQNSAELPEVIDAWEALNMASMEYLDNLQELYLLAVAYEKELER